MAKSFVSTVHHLPPGGLQALIVSHIAQVSQSLGPVEKYTYDMLEGRLTIIS